ncbi:MAG: hypothetical protein IJ125_06585 [Atopobiaceae bacterium]|nr:hypothetical protein [Atopobiaceae bacterium]
MANILEVAMLLCFGASWPINLRKALISQSTKGVSLGFLCLIEVGYICGLAAKFIGGNVTYVVAFYVLNLVVVAANIAVYFINRNKETA